MIGCAVAGDTPMMVADECGVSSHMGHAGLLPEQEFAPPVLAGPGTRGHPNLDTYVFWVSTSLTHQSAQFLKCPQRRIARREVKWHEAIPVFRCTPKCRLGVTAEPYWNAASWRARVDTGVVDTMELAGEGNMLLPPQCLHDSHLLRGSLAAIMKILIQTHKLNLVPANADTEAESAPAENIEAGRLLSDQDGLTLRQNQDAGGQTDFAGAPSQKAEKNKRIMESFFTCADA
jgi:hypothetical protein